MGHWIVLWPGYSREMLSAIWLQTVSGSTIEVVQPLTGLTVDWSGEGVVFLLAGCWQDCNFLLIVLNGLYYLMLQITVCKFSSTSQKVSLCIICMRKMCIHMQIKRPVVHVRVLVDYEHTKRTQHAPRT